MHDAVVLRQGVGEELHQLGRAAAAALYHALSGPLPTRKKTKTKKTADKGEANEIMNKRKNEGKQN